MSKFVTLHWFKNILFGMKKKGTFVLAAAILISSMISCGVKKNDRPDEEISSNGMVLDLSLIHI